MTALRLAGWRSLRGKIEKIIPVVTQKNGTFQRKQIFNTDPWIFFVLVHLGHPMFLLSLCVSCSEFCVGVNLVR